MHCARFVIASLLAISIAGSAGAQTPRKAGVRPTMILTSVYFPKTLIEQKLNEIVPRNEQGAQANPVGNPVVDDVLTWQFARQPIAVRMTAGAIVGATTISGVVRIWGNVRLIRGDIGRFLGRLNPTNIPFSAHANLRARTTVSIRPQLKPSWRVLPNLAATAHVDEAVIPINHVGRISVRGHVQRALDGKLADLRGRFEAALRNDDRLEKEARKAWDKLCGAFPLDIDKDKKPDLYLRIAPVSARAAQPAISATGVTFQIGIEANTEISADPKSPECEFPAAVKLLPLAKPLFEIGLPIDMPYAELNKAASARLPEKFMRADHAVTLEVKSAAIGGGANGRVAIVADVVATEKGWFFGLFRKQVAAKISISAIPRLDSLNQRIRFEEVDLDVASKSLFGVTQTLANAAAPLIEGWVETKLAIDVGAQAKKLPAMAQAVVAKLNSQSGNLTVQGRLETPKLVSITAGDTSIRLHGQAQGSITATLR